MVDNNVSLPFFFSSIIAACFGGSTALSNRSGMVPKTTPKLIIVVVYNFLLLSGVYCANNDQYDTLTYLEHNQYERQVGIPYKDEYLFTYDDFYDMNGSAKNLISVSHLFGRGIDAIVCTKDAKSGFDICVEKESYLGRIFIGFINYYFNDICFSVQHEIMGHGYRAREAGAEINGYHISLSLGVSRAYVNKDDMAYYDRLFYHTGGCESSIVYAREAFRQLLLNDYSYHYYYYTINLKMIDEPYYILALTPSVDSYEWNVYSGGGWDIRNFIEFFSEKSDLTREELLHEAQKGAYWSLADPSLIMSLFYYLKDYLILGRSQVKNPMFRFRGVYFLPFTDFHLSPYGNEYYLGDYLRVNRKLFEVYARWSSGNVDGSGQGFGLYLTNIYSRGDLRFDTGFDIWRQEFDIRYYEKDDELYNKDFTSGRIYLKGNYQFKKSVSAWGQLGYKGKGFLLGNPLDDGFNLKLGMGFYF